MKQFNDPVVNAANNASTNFPALDSQQLYGASFIVSFTDAAAAGTLKIQASNDPTADPNNFVPTHWIDVPSASVVVAAGATSNVPMPAQFCFRWLRVVWTRTAGAGKFTVNMYAQGF